ncbi:vWA domain-containing protein [Humisphaera borealis]|uniref:VWA domain-containing protein n=1 Tax=Humisphaera borealis TaxID=2807512 RepID=A0A7M2WTF6_9BACT|nr:vWA domain-containing protein [Humisphaera borealis]QOV88798.1 VWA domain-containing protein [Humisphaera borealis]
MGSRLAFTLLGVLVFNLAASAQPRLVQPEPAQPRPAQPQPAQPQPVQQPAGGERFWCEFPSDGSPRIWTQIADDTWEERWFGGVKQHKVVGPSDDPNRPGTIVAAPNSMLQLLVPPKGSGGLVGIRGGPGTRWGSLGARRELVVDPKFAGVAGNLPPDVDVGDSKVAAVFLKSQVRSLLRRTSPDTKLIGVIIVRCRAAVLYNTDPSKLSPADRDTLAYLNAVTAQLAGGAPAGGQPPTLVPVVPPNPPSTPVAAGGNQPARPPTPPAAGPGPGANPGPIPAPTTPPPATPQTTAPTTPSLTPEQIARRNQEGQALLDYLMKQYDGLLIKTRERLGRSMTLVCIARIPRADATAKLLEVLQSERDVTVKMVAWQCLLARANGMTETEFRKWLDLTTPLVNARAFAGTLRVPLLQVLALRPPDRAAREFLLRTLDECNTLDPDDDVVLFEVAETLRAWGDPTIVDLMMPRLRKYEEMERVEAVLHRLGCEVTWSHYRNLELASARMMDVTPGEYEAWWRSTRPAWRPRTTMEPGAWRKLRGQFVPTVDMSQSVDPKDPSWRRDLELRSPGLQPFTLGLVVDTTGSMGPALLWVRRDLKRIADAIRLVALEPAVNCTFYRDVADQFVAKTLPTTGNLQKLGNWFSTAEAQGGEDGPEAVREGLADNFDKGNYPAAGKRAVVVIGDAPPHANTQSDCERLVKMAADRGFRLYAIKTRTGHEAPDLSAFDKLATIANGSSRWFYLLHKSPLPIRAAARGVGTMPEPRAVPNGTYLPKVVNTDELAEAGEWLMSQVLADAVNPEFAPRVKPVAGVVWQLLKQPLTEQRLFYIPNGGDKTPKKGIPAR